MYNIYIFLTKFKGVQLHSLAEWWLCHWSRRSGIGWSGEGRVIQVNISISVGCEYLNYL